MIAIVDELSVVILEETALVFAEIFNRYP